MSVIQRIQQRQKWVFGAIALALILFIVQDRFMGHGGMSGGSTTIGKVNGETIDHSDFRSQEELLKQSNPQATDNEQVTAYIWENMVNKIIMDQEFEKLGLSYTNKEFGEDIGSNNPPQWFRTQFQDQSTGVYNGQGAATYMQQVTTQMRKNPSNQQTVLFQKAVIDPAIDEQLGKKYQGLISGAVYVPKWMADKTAADNSSIANISYVSVPYTSIADSTIKVTDDDIKAYVQKHSKEYEQKDETRQIAYVMFDATPSVNDSAKVSDDLVALKGEFASATDVKPFLEEKASAIPYYASYLSKKEIHQPINDTLFKLRVGEVFGPYKDGGNYALAKMVDEKQLPDSVTVRHILVATHQRDQQTGQLQRVVDDSTASKRLDSAVAEIKAGKNFDSVCAKYSDDGTKNTGGVYPYFQTGKMVEEFNDFVFTGKTGDAKVVHTAYGYHYVQILGQKGSEPAYKIAYLSRPVRVSQETDDSAKNIASKFAGTTHNLKEFYDNAAKIKKSPFTIPGLKENDYMVGGMGMNPRFPGMGGNGLGKNRQFVKWVYGNDVGTISEAFRFDQKYVVAIITAVNKAGVPNAETARPLVEGKIRNEKKAKLIIDSKIKGNTLEAIAQSSGVAVQQADSINFASGMIKTLGNEPKVVGAAFNKELQSKVSSPFDGNSGVFVVKSNGVAGVASQHGSIEDQRKAAELTLKQQEYSAVQALTKAADIKDYRSKFY